MTYGRMRNRNGIAWRPGDERWPYPDRQGPPLPEQGRAYPSRGQCWICDESVPSDRVDLGTCSTYHQGVWDADHGAVRARAFPTVKTVGWAGLVGDLNRMEWDYITGVSGVAGSGPDPAEECALAIGVNSDVVRRVLAYVFRESR